MAHYLVDLPGQQQEWLSVLVGITLLVMALLQLYKMMFIKWIITRFISAAGAKDIALKRPGSITRACWSAIDW